MLTRVVYRIVLTDEYIEDAQRLNIEQNPALRFMYQTKWVRWFPRITFAGTLVVLLVLRQTTVAMITGALLLLTFVAEFHSRWVLAKARRRVRFKGSALTVRMDDDGVDIDGAVGHSHLEWAALLPPVIRSDGVLLKLFRFRGIWLPDTGLVEGSAAETRQLLAEKCKLSELTES